eukprot:2687388-Alexandrium_andersonii.AAC.1
MQHRLKRLEPELRGPQTWHRNVLFWWSRGGPPRAPNGLFGGLGGALEGVSEGVSEGFPRGVPRLLRENSWMIPGCEGVAR